LGTIISLWCSLWPAIIIIRKEDSFGTQQTRSARQTGTKTHLHRGTCPTFVAPTTKATFDYKRTWTTPSCTRSAQSSAASTTQQINNSWQRPDHTGSV